MRRAADHPEGGAEATAGGAAANLLIVSDLHLGEGLEGHLGDDPPAGERPAGGRPSEARIAQLERELIEFLDHYRTHRLDGRPWRLVVAGDMVDFMAITIRPDRATRVSEDERRYGLRPAPAVVRRKLSLVMRRHREVFRRLAAFVHAGNELVVVLGNHDAELYFEEVHQGFFDALVELAPAPLAEAERDAMRARMRFTEWFYYQRDLELYVEHGHQYDAYSSFDYHLHPLGPDGVELAPTFGHFGMRYFVQASPAIDWADQERWTFFDYVRWVASHGPAVAGRILLQYLRFISQVLASRFADSWRRARERQRMEHARRLRQLAVRAGLDEATLQRLAGLGHRPAWRSLPRIFSVFYLDRMLLAVAALAALVVALSAGSGWWSIGGAAGCLLGFVSINAVLARLRDLRTSALLAQASRQIRQVLGARLIVMGHTHEPRALPLSDGGWYINIGSWLPHGHAGGGERTEGRAEAFTHLLLRRMEAAGAAGARGVRALAELCVWREGKSHPLEAVEVGSD